MMAALARQGHSRTEQAGLLARAALAVAAERMGGRPPESFLQGEEALRAEIIKNLRRRLKIAPDDRSDEALRAIEEQLDAEMEAAAEPVDVGAALTRTTALLTPVVLGERLCLQAHTAPICAVALTPDGKRAISGSLDGVLKVWDLDAGGLLTALRGYGAWDSIALTPDGKRAISGSYDRTLKVWDLEVGGLPLATLEAHEDCVRAIAVTPDSKRAISGSHDRTLKIWELEGCGLLATLEGHGSWVIAVAVTLDGKRAVSGSLDGTLKVWDLDSMGLVAALEDRGAKFMALALTPDGKRAISGLLDGTLKVWDLEGGRLLATLAGHGDSVQAVAVTPDGRRAISGSRDGMLRVWDLQAYAEIACFGINSPVYSCAGSLDGRLVVVGDILGRLHVIEILA